MLASAFDDNWLGLKYQFSEQTSDLPSRAEKSMVPTPGHSIISEEHSSPATQIF
jgi:hypothetical protein